MKARVRFVKLAPMDSIIVSSERRRDRPERSGLSCEALVLIESTGGRIRSTDRESVAAFRRGELGDRRRGESGDRRLSERRARDRRADRAAG